MLTFPHTFASQITKGVTFLPLRIKSLRWQTNFRVNDVYEMNHTRPAEMKSKEQRFSHLGTQLNFRVSS